MSAQEPPRHTADREGLRQEYAEVHSNIRHYSLLRFTILTVYFAAFGGLASVAFGFVVARAGDAEALEFGARVAGALVTGLFLHYESLIVEVLNKTRQRGRCLEVLLGYQLISLRSQDAIAVSQRLARVFYWTLLVFWLLMSVESARTLFH